MLCEGWRALHDSACMHAQVVPQGTTVGDASMSWLHNPGQLAGLPSGALLAMPSGDDARVLEWGPEGSNQLGPCSPRVSQVLRLVPELACAVMTSGSRMRQKQVPPCTC